MLAARGAAAGKPDFFLAASDGLSTATRRTSGPDGLGNEKTPASGRGSAFGTGDADRGTDQASAGAASAAAGGLARKLISSASC